MPEETPTELKFASLSDAVTHAENLLQTGYQAHGQWSLGQVCQHLTAFTVSSLDGFSMRLGVPWPLTILTKRMIFSDKAVRQPMPKGLPTPKMFKPDAASDDAAEVAAFAEACRRFDERLAAGGPFAKSPLVGKITPEQWHYVHLKHAGHHLGFLSPAGSD
jgi:hypothetical protein